MAVLLSSLSDEELVSFVYNHPTELNPLEWELAIRFRKSTEQIEAQENIIIGLEDCIDEIVERLNELEHLNKP